MFENKIALVTGGTSGIGKEIVKELLDKKCIVITCYHNNEEAANETKEEFNNENLLIIKCDVSNENEVIKMFYTIKEKYNHIDYLVNNAGTFIDNFIKDFNIDDFRKVLDVNLIGKVMCTKYAYPIMNNGGSIVNMIRYEVGEGMQKREENFAEEVAKQMQGN